MVGGAHGRCVHMAGGMCMAGGVHGRGACVAGGHAWWGDSVVGGQDGGGHMWQGVCMAGETATAAGGTHPTGMHSW